MVCGPTSQLKHDVVRIGTVADGIGLYRFQYNWSDQVYVGVIAQEVQAIRPDAVVRDSDGYLRVVLRQDRSAVPDLGTLAGLRRQGAGR